MTKRIAVYPLMKNGLMAREGSYTRHSFVVVRNKLNFLCNTNVDI